MTGPRIVIVTYNWPPRNAIGTHRPYAWARYWSEAGAKVTVLTARKQAFDAPLDMPLPVLDGVDVVEVSYSGPGGGLTGMILKSEHARHLAKRLRAWLGSKNKALSDPRGAWRPAAEDEALRLAREADIVVSTFGPAASHLIAYDMKTANPNLLWLADYRDLWSENRAVEMGGAARAKLREIELATVGAAADLITAVSDDMVERLETLTGKRTLKFTNGFDMNEDLVRSRLLSPASKPDGPLRIVYTGMIYRGHRDPTPLLDALAGLHAAGELEPGAVTVDVYGARVEVAKELARNPAYGPFIRLMGHVPREEALKAQREAGLLLLLENSEPEARGILTGKLFEYIAAGRPILCVGSKPEFEIGQVLAATGAGRVYGIGDCAEICEVILETVKGEGLYEVYRPNITRILKYSRKYISNRFLKQLIKINNSDVLIRDKT